MCFSNAFSIGNRNAIPAPGLGCIGRRIGAPQQAIEIRIVLLQYRHADRHGELQPQSHNCFGVRER